jgi:hypothetical protein
MMALVGPDEDATVTVLEVGMDFIPREARLKSEFGELYPPLVAGIWETAAEMGAKVLLWQVQQQGTDALSMRILDERHFEFRGGWYRGSETDLRTRASDPAFNGPA